MDDKWYSFLAGHPARNIALLILIAVFVGNFLVELGEVLAAKLGFDGSHFLRLVLAVGVVGVIGFSIALFRR